MRIFITGAKGQLGSTLQRLLSEHDVFSADLPEIDVTDKESIVGTIVSSRPDMVIHCAAYTDVEGCAKNPELAYRVNVLGTQNVALACQQVGADMVHLSTNEVFAGDRREGYEEWMPVDPGNPYARSKAASEYFVANLLTRFYIVRTAWLYSSAGSNFIHSILQAGREGRQLRVVTDEIGNPTYVEDLAAAIGKLIVSGQYGVYHFVNEGYCSRYTFAREALNLCDMRDVPIIPILSSEYDRASTPPKYSALNNVAGKAIGIRLRPWQEALAAYLEALI